MGGGSGLQNRKPRRAAARDSSEATEGPSSTINIEMARPQASKREAKTLVELLEERKATLEQNGHFKSSYPESDVGVSVQNILEAGLGDADPIGPVGNAVFNAAAFGMIHFTFDVLVYNQYRQEILWNAILSRTATILPVLFLLSLMTSSKIARKLSVIKQIVLLAMATVAGCYCIHITNRHGYYAVMQYAPPAGTLWIWSVVEMKLEFALVTLLIDLGYLWWKSYTIF